MPKNQPSSANLGTATGVIDTTERAVININNSITNVNAIITGDGPVAELMDGETITNIDGDVLDDVQDGRDALEQAAELTESSSLEIAEWVICGSDSSSCGSRGKCCRRSYRRCSVRCECSPFRCGPQMLAFANLALSPLGEAEQHI